MNIFKKPRTLAQQLFAAMGYLGNQLAKRQMRKARTNRKRHPLMITASAKEIADWNHVVVMLKKARAERRRQRDAVLKQRSEGKVVYG